MKHKLSCNKHVKTAQWFLNIDTGLGNPIQGPNLSIYKRNQTDIIAVCASYGMCFTDLLVPSPTH